MTVPPGKAGVNLSIGTCWYIHDGTQHKKPGFFSTAVENKARFMGRDMFCRFYVAAQWCGFTFPIGSGYSGLIVSTGRSL